MKYTVVISDVHLFSRVCKHKSLHRFFKEIKKTTKTLIILGDLFDGDDFDKPRKSSKKGHVKILAAIRGLADSGVKVIWIEGNHDHSTINYFNKLIGAKKIEQGKHFEKFINGKKWIFMHGHQFDTFINENPMLTMLGTWAYNKIQEFDGRNYQISRWLKKKSKQMLSIYKANKDRAIKYARKNKAQFIVCGHVHQVSEVEEDGVIYINTGCWVDDPSHYLRIDNSGKYEVLDFCQIMERGNDRNKSKRKGTINIGAAKYKSLNEEIRGQSPLSDCHAP